MAFVKKRRISLLSHLCKLSLCYRQHHHHHQHFLIPFDFCITAIIRFSSLRSTNHSLFSPLSFSELRFYRKTSTSWWSTPTIKETSCAYSSSRTRRQQLPVGRGAYSKKWLVSGINNKCLLQLQARPPSVSRILTGGGTGRCCSRWTIRDWHSWEFVSCFGFFALNKTDIWNKEYIEDSFGISISQVG